MGKVINFFLTSEFLSNTELDTTDTNTDVIVQLDSGEKYIATFFSFSTIESLRIDHQRTKAFLAGKCFYAKNMILVDDCSRDTIRDVIEGMIDEGDFTTIFEQITA